jgi:UMF1 family MFS transporter
LKQGYESSFFALFSLTDKSASFLGPAIVGLIRDKTNDIRYGYYSILALLVIPIPFLLKVSPEDGVEEAKVWSDQKKPNSALRIA